MKEHLAELTEAITEWQQVAATIRRDGSATLNPTLPMKPEELDQAFVLWLESLIVDERMLLALELHGLTNGTQFHRFTNEHMKKIILSESEKPGVLCEPLARFHQVLIAGRLCWQLDIDVFLESGSYTRRNIFIPAGNVVYDLGWAMTEPRLRAWLDEELELMVQIGAPFQKSPEEDIQGQQLLSLITEAQKKSTKLAKVQAALKDTLDIQGAAIGRTQSFLYDTRGGTPFGIARRAGNNAGAISTNEIAIYETYNPGAVIKVSMIDAKGTESVVWTSDSDQTVSESNRILSLKIGNSMEAKLLKIELNSPAASGWNEIDTVGIQDERGEWHWPIRADASSSYASGDIAPHFRAFIHKK